MHEQFVKTYGMRLAMAGAVLALTFVSQDIARAQVTSANGVTVLKVQGAGAVNFASATALAVPSNPVAPNITQDMINALLHAPAPAPSGGSVGERGTGAATPETVPASAPASGITSQDFGTSDIPFSTERADGYGPPTNTSYPYRAAGRLFFNISGATYVCSASMIKRGVVVTAAHCVANYGAHQFYSGWQFVPGYRSGAAPYGVWTAATAIILTAYYNGTDGCAVYGVVCPDDVAVIVLNTQSGGYVGTATGWFGYWYGGGYTPNGLFHITQLGYPVGLDNGLFQERNDSQGYINNGLSNNTVIGSNMNGGSSGGPWVENFGYPSALTGETNGSFPYSDVIVGVTSWGYGSTAIKAQGAAPFTFGNIQTLLNVACAGFPAACS